MDEKFLFNKTDTAKAMGITIDGINKWDIKPVKTRGREKLYYLPDVIQYRLQRSAKSADELVLTSERARLAKEQADKTAMENAIKRGELVDLPKVADALTKILTNVKTRLLAIPRRAAPLVLGCKTLPQVEDQLVSLVHEALTELSNDPLTSATE
jgi:phage terminase Nu1 subunit (DNA packaging protein)